MTKKDRKRLKELRDLVVEELKKNKEVIIPGFGKFYLKSSPVCLDHPMSYEASFWSTHIQQNVRFRSFPSLKESIRNRRPICLEEGTSTVRNTMCRHPDGEGHEGLHVNYRGEEYSIAKDGPISKRIYQK